MKLNNKVALVTGGTRGIGREIVLEFIKEGISVAFFYHKNTRMADKLVNEINKSGKKIIALKVDVSDFNQTKQACLKVLKIFKKVDIAVNNAGIKTNRSLLVNMSKKDWDLTLNTNLTGVFNVTKAVAPIMIKQKRGVIINISSIAILKPLKGYSNYTASKSGVIGFTKAIALELARFGVRVNAVVPGYMGTELLHNTFPNINDKFLRSFVPLRRIGKPEELAKLVKFLVSEDAKYITGQAIIIDGGLSLK